MNLFFYKYELSIIQEIHIKQISDNATVRYGTWRRKTAHGDGERILR